MFVKGNPYRLKPKYTNEDMKLIKDCVARGDNFEDIISLVRNNHPDVSSITIYRWMEKAATELGVLDKHDK